MVCVDRRGRIARVNAQTERLFGYQRDELVGEPVEILIPEMVLSARRRDGSTFPAEISLSTIDTDDGLVVIAAVRDVPEQLESTGQLGGGVAQDVSNLLAVISNYAAFVGDEVAKDGAQVNWQSIREDVRQIQLAARRAADLTLLPATGRGIQAEPMPEPQPGGGARSGPA
jgi:PAS domain-containing protein